VQSIRLIYSGKLLQDNLTLKDCIRHNSEVKNHIIHLVHSSNNLANSKSSKLSPPDPMVANDSNEFDLENELTPNTSTSSDVSTAESSASEDFVRSLRPGTSSNPANPLLQSNANINNFNRIQTNLNSFYRLQSNPQGSTLTEKEQYNQILNQLNSYYESFGIQVQSNPWYSSYLQHLALYNLM
jgi:hypothetical protein